MRGELPRNQLEGLQAYKIYLGTLGKVTLFCLVPGRRSTLPANAAALAYVLHYK
jgi:hypothetical protein